MFIDSHKSVGCIPAVRQAHDLYKLVNDQAYTVRAEVAKHGFGLDKLIHDLESRVRSEAIRILNNQNKEK